MKALKKRGIFIIYVIIAASFITIFLIGAVKNMHESFFLTKKFTGEVKSRWAAESGIEYCKYRLKQNLGWPFDSSKSVYEPTTFGSFTVNETKYGDGFLVHGKSEEHFAEFIIYFSKKKTQKDGDIEGEKIQSIVPDSFPQEPANISYCSYSSIDIKDTAGGVKQDDSALDKFNNEYIEVCSKPKSHKAVVASPGIYIASEGRSGIYKTIIENLIIADNSNIFGAGVYAGGDIKVNILGTGSIFSISRQSTSQPEVYCKGNFSLTRTPDPEITEKYKFPCVIEDGTIYYGSTFNLEDSNETKNSSITTSDNDSTNYIARKYGIKVDKYDGQLFPSMPWGKIQDSISELNLNSIKSGTYAAIWHKQKNAYKLYYISNNNYLLPTGEYANAQGEASQDTESTNIIQEILNARRKAEEDKEKFDDALNKYWEQLAAWKEDPENNKEPSEPSITAQNGNIFTRQNQHEILEDDNVFAYFAQDMSNDENFSIETALINNKLTPIVEIKNSVKVEGSGGISFLTLQEDNAGSDNSLLTPLVGVNANVKLGSKHLPDNFENMLTFKSTSKTSILSSKLGEQAVTIYSEGPVIIKGKLSGNGQVLGGNSVFMEAGSEINSQDSDYNTSNLAIYAKGSVKMGHVRQIDNIDNLYNRLKEAMINIQGSSIDALVSKILDKKIKITNEDLLKVNANSTSQKLKAGEEVSILKLMTQGYGYSRYEAEMLVKNNVERNYNTEIKTKQNGNTDTIYKTPASADLISFFERSPATFSGVIYTCGGFAADGGGEDFTINGALVSYGADPSSGSNPGSGVGLSDSVSLLGIGCGDIVINDCKNFSVVYDSSDVQAFVANYNGAPPVNFTSVYYNKL